MVAHVLERHIDTVANLIIGAAREAYPAGLGKPFQPGRHVDPVALDIVAVDYHIAQIDADAELHALVLRQIGVALGNRPLRLDGGTNRIDDTCELDQHAVAHELDDSPIVLRDRGIDDLRPQCLEGAKRAFLVRSNQSRVADNVSGHNGGETAFHACPPWPESLATNAGRIYSRPFGSGWPLKAMLFISILYGRMVLEKQWWDLP